jgi:hypothetical protein
MLSNHLAGQCPVVRRHVRRYAAATPIAPIGSIDFAVSVHVLFAVVSPDFATSGDPAFFNAA